MNAPNDAGAIASASHATSEGTRRYAARLATSGRAIPAHFRAMDDLLVSSIGTGTYLGNADDATDARYRSAIESAIQSGANVVDLAVSYRGGRSERAAGAAIASLLRNGEIARDEIVVSTKAGYIPAGGGGTDPRRAIEDAYVKTGILRAEEIAGGNHAMAPRFLEDQIARSLENTGLRAFDVYFLHNPEAHLKVVGREEFLKRVRAAFLALEAAADAGRIVRYGVATWGGFRSAPDDPGYLSLAELVAIAREIGGPHHRFRVVQLPLNLLMLEALALANQAPDLPAAAESDEPIEGVTFLDAAKGFGLSVWTSATLFQSKLARRIPGEFARAIPGLSTDAQRAIQFVRSAPGVTVALVGTSQSSHAVENLELALVPPIPAKQFLSRFFGTG
jgi:aryl-alcohol dehydrogenase-like predicted oxidoreductase